VSRFEIVDQNRCWISPSSSPTPRHRDYTTAHEIASHLLAAGKLVSRNGRPVEAFGIKGRDPSDIKSPANGDGFVKDRAQTVAAGRHLRVTPHQVRSLRLYPPSVNQRCVGTTGRSHSLRPRVQQERQSASTRCVPARKCSPRALCPPSGHPDTNGNRGRRNVSKARQMPDVPRRHLKDREGG